MPNSWVRLWHEMPTDPKWRVVARKEIGEAPEETRKIYRTGFMYAIQRKSDGAIKIGISAKPRQRLCTIRCTRSEDQFRLVATVPVSSMRETEKLAHRALSGWRVEFEWFRIDVDSAMAFLGAIGPCTVIDGPFEKTWELPEYQEWG